MSRTVPAAILSALQGASVEPFYAVEAQFTGGTVRLWTGYGDRQIEGNTYTGAGSLLSISGLDEVADLSAKSITVTLSGIDQTVLSLALAEPYQRRKLRVLFGVVGNSASVELFSGQMNTMTIEDSGETSTVTILVDSKLVELERASNRRYTSESQKSRHAGDTFFDYVAKLQDRQLVWGRASE
jgi:hypothetical protein